MACVPVERLREWGMEFRRATRQDAERIALLHADSWQRTYRGMMPEEFPLNEVVSERLAAWHARLREERDDRFLYLAVDDDRLAGFICVVGGEDPRWGSYIDNLHVGAGYQGSGLGAQLLAAAGRWCCERYPEAGVYLWVFEANLGARRFYERRGGRNYETLVQTDPGGGSAPCCRYVWDRPQLLLAA